MNDNKTFVVWKDVKCKEDVSTCHTFYVDDEGKDMIEVQNPKLHKKSVEERNQVVAFTRERDDVILDRAGDTSRTLTFATTW